MISPTNDELSTLQTLLSNYIGDKIEKNFFDNIIFKINIYVSMLLMTNKDYNLIGKSTIQQIWMRHIIDSCQLVKFLNDKEFDTIIDLGSGAGFPAIIIAIFTQKKIIMVEKSHVKAKFLKSVCNELELFHLIICDNITKDNINDAIKFHSNDKIVITSRAFKGVYDIFNLLKNAKLLNNVKKILLLKGDKWQDEVERCKKKDSSILKRFNCFSHNSITGNGVVLEFKPV